MIRLMGAPMIPKMQEVHKKSRDQQAMQVSNKKRATLKQFAISNRIKDTDVVSNRCGDGSRSRLRR